MTQTKPVLSSGRSDPAALILASRSPGRLKTLRSAGVWPKVLVSEVDEDAVVSALPADVGPRTTVIALALEKARAVASTIQQHGLSERTTPSTVDTLLVVGADSMLLRDGRMEGKPRTPEAAKTRWQMMSGGTSELWSGHGIVKLGKTPSGWRVTEEAAEASVATIHFAQLSEEEIDAYISTGEPLGVAGGFTIDALGGPFIESITGDPHGVVGLSLPLLRTLAKNLGVQWSSLWAGNPRPAEK